MKKTKIVCTVGPSTDRVGLLGELLLAGMDVARFNFSHGSHDDHARRLGLVRQAEAQVQKVVATMADTRGPEIRLGLFEQGSVVLEEGASFTLTTEQVLGNAQRSQVSYTGLPQEVSRGTKILLADGLLALEVESVTGSEIYTRVIHGGQVSDRKRVACPGLELQLPFLSPQDEKDLHFALEQHMDYVAASFVQKAEDVLAIRRIIEQHGARMGIIAKIENAAGVKHLDEILNVADGIMVARGDLGVEIPYEYVPLVQKRIIAACNKAGKPVITATQMLESMMHSYRATRAEASDVANSILDGTDAIMLSGETASGEYPLQAVQTMAKIALRTEASLDYGELFQRKGLQERIHATEAISHATVQIAQEIRADAILTITETGLTARMLAKYRPQAKIIAVVSQAAQLRLLQLYWGVQPVLGPTSASTDEMIELSLGTALEQQLLEQGASVVVTAGAPVGKPGSTNLIKVVTVANKLVCGVGIGKKIVTGRVCKALKSVDFVEKLQPGAILVVDVLNDEDVALAAKKSAAIIAEEGGLTSSTAIVGISCGLPVVVGAHQALERLEDGQLVTVDTISGIVYEGAIDL